MPEPAQETQSPVDEMLVDITFAVRLGELFKEFPDEELVTQTRQMLVGMTEGLMTQHPAAHLHGEVNVTIQLHRA